MSEEKGISHARLGLPQPGNPKKMKQQGSFDVQFNPTSLDFTIKNTLKKGRGNSRKQYVSQSTGQLTMELIFDTTHDGVDVRTKTKKVSDFMKPDEQKIPPIVQFEWGTFMFRGMVESYKETIDFFSYDGVPLRSTLNVTLSSQDKVFDTSGEGGNGNQGDDAVQVPSSPSLDPASAAAQAGNPGAGRDLATANNQESMRFASGPITVDPSVELSPPAAFASGGIGLGAGLSAGAGIGGGLGVGGGAGISGGLGVGAGAGVGAEFSAGGAIGISGGAGVSAAIGGSASAGISASAGAFAGLQASTSSARKLSTLNASNLLPDPPALGLATDSGASFQVGGQAAIEGSASIGADVGVSASLTTRIQFDE